MQGRSQDGAERGLPAVILSQARLQKNFVCEFAEDRTTALGIGYLRAVCLNGGRGQRFCSCTESYNSVKLYENVQ
jgi:hypothetical protein